MSKTKPHPKRTPPPAKLDVEYFPRVFHVVILDPLKLSAVLTSVVDPDPDPGSGSVLDPYSIGPLDPDPDP